MHCHNHPSKNAVCIVQTQLTLDMGVATKAHIMFLGLCAPCYHQFIREKVAQGYI